MDNRRCRHYRVQQGTAEREGSLNNSLIRNALQKNFDICIPRKGTARPQFQFPLSFVCEREIAQRNMIVGIGTVAAEFLVWEYMFQI
jgi:hypothetical protein